MPRKQMEKERGVKNIDMDDFPDVALHKLHQGLYMAVEVEERFSREDLTLYQFVKSELDRRGYLVPEGYPFLLLKAVAQNGPLE